MSVTISLWERKPFFFINGWEELDDSVLDTLEEELSYEVPDAEYTDAWKSGEWDGMHRLLRRTKSDGTPYFPIGLLSRVKTVLDLLGVEYEVEGLVYPGTGDIPLGWETEMTLRPYQQDAVDEALSHGSGVVVLPTGAGKTLIGLYLMHKLQHRTVVFCHLKEVAQQWVEQIEDILGFKPARRFDGHHENGDVMVALYQSVYDNDTGDVRDGVDLSHEVALFDEVHRVGADTFETVALSASASYRFGFSATPEREDNATLRVIGSSGPIIADLSAERLIEEGYLAEPEWNMVEAPSVGGGYQNWQEEYKAEIVENDRRNQMIAQKVKGLDRPTLVTVERINPGERLEATIDGVGGVDGVEFIHGSSSDRDEVIQGFRDGEVPVLIATRGIVGEGFDVPEIASFVVAGGLKSSTSMIQQVGRSLRPGTETAQIIDMWDRGQWIGEHSESRVRTYQEYYGSKFGP